VTPVEQVTANGTTWQHVRFWSGNEGYIAASALGPQPPSPPQAPLPCDYPGVPSAQPDPLSSSRDAFPLTASGVTMAAATLYPQADEGALPATALPLGTRLTISQWAADGSGRPWYHVSANGTNGWVWSGTVRLEQPNPATREVHGAPIWTPIAGKG